MRHGERLRLDTLRALCEEKSIDELYSYFDFDYELEMRGGATPSARSRFIEIFDWRLPPSSEVVRRLFNQINACYAENSILAKPYEDPKMIVLSVAPLLLFRQGKPSSLRAAPIQFGRRANLDFRDPLSQLKWLYGIAPRHLADALTRWGATVDASHPSPETALLLTLMIIAIHPFVDANGRAARLLYTWMCRRWGLDDEWLSEHHDGEFLRVGQGLESTEYLLGRVIADLAGSHNVVVDYRPVPSIAAEDAAWQAMYRNLDDVARGVTGAELLPSFLPLLKHMRANDHFRATSPRFECLRTHIL